MAEFYSARGWEIPPLPWTNLSPPFSPEVGHIHHEYRMRHKSGAWRWVRDQVNLVRGDGNTANIDHLAGFWIDVTADILALEESEDRLSDYAESAADWF